MPSLSHRSPPFLEPVRSPRALVTFCSLWSLKIAKAKLGRSWETLLLYKSLFTAHIRTSQAENSGVPNVPSLAISGHLLPSLATVSAKTRARKGCWREARWWQIAYGQMATKWKQDGDKFSKMLLNTPDFLKSTSVGPSDPFCMFLNLSWDILSIIVYHVQCHDAMVTNLVKFDTALRLLRLRCLPQYA